MNDQSPPDNLPIEAYEQARELVPTHGSTAIQTQGNGSVARKIVNPRNLVDIMKNIKVLAAMAGDDWYYRWSTKNKDGTKGWVEGPSIKCATAVARMYGNCEVDCVVGESQTHHIFEARFVDLETGFCLTRPFQQRKSQNIGGNMDAARQADIIFQIGVSKATRNVINNALESFTDYAKEEAKKSLVEKISKNLEGNRQRIGELLKEMNVDVKRVELIYGRTQAEWLAPDMAKIYAEIRAINDGMANKDETYPPTQQEVTAHLEQTAGTPGGANAEIASGQAAAEIPATADWKIMLDDLLDKLNLCKDQKSVSQFLNDNEKNLNLISNTAPSDIQGAWTKAITMKMKDMSPKKAADKKEGGGTLAV